MDDSHVPARPDTSEKGLKRPGLLAVAAVVLLATLTDWILMVVGPRITAAEVIVFGLGVIAFYWLIPLAFTERLSTPLLLLLAMPTVAAALITAWLAYALLMPGRV
jgi:hypothetical protein